MRKLTSQPTFTAYKFYTKLYRHFIFRHDMAYNLLEKIINIPLTEYLIYFQCQFKDHFDITAYLEPLKSLMQTRTLFPRVLYKLMSSRRKTKVLETFLFLFQVLVFYFKIRATLFYGNIPYFGC